MYLVISPFGCSPNDLLKLNANIIIIIIIKCASDAFEKINEWKKNHFVLKVCLQRWNWNSIYGQGITANNGLKSKWIGYGGCVSCLMVEWTHSMRNWKRTYDYCAISWNAINLLNNIVHRLFKVKNLQTDSANKEQQQQIRFFPLPKCNQLHQVLRVVCI